MYIGQLRNQIPSVHGRDDVPGGTLSQGTVVYMHPARRYYTLEYRTRTGAFREAFPFPSRAGRR